MYAAGVYDVDATHASPCYWITDSEGPTKQDLPIDTPSGIAMSIYVSEGTVYTGGYEINVATQKPCFWTGTTRTDLTEGIDNNGWVYSIFVSNGTVYMGGNYMDASNISIPCYWANTSKQDLPGPASDYAYVRSIYVSGGTVYSGGWINNGSLQIRCYW